MCLGTFSRLRRSLATFTLYVAVRILAERFCRGFWNISFKLCSMIPFLGWTAHFIIADTAQEKASKKGYQEEGQKRDSAAYDYAEKRAKIKLEEQKREQMDFEERRRMENAITSQLKNISNHTTTVGDRKILFFHLST